MTTIRRPHSITVFECAETDYDSRGDCDGLYGVGETATYAYGQQPRQAVELCRSHGMQAVATGQLVRWTEYDVQPDPDLLRRVHTFERCSGPCPVHRPAPTEQRLQLAVTYADDVTRYYPIKYGWRIDVTHRQIVIGRGVPRTAIPLDSVRAYTIEQAGGRNE